MSSRFALPLMATLVGPGCGSPPAPAPDAAITGMESGWIPALIQDPAAFSRTVDGPERDGWVALHRGDSLAAASSLKGAGNLRAWLGRASYSEDQARLQALVFTLGFEAWQARGGLPAGSAMPVLAALVALDRGDEAAAGAWLDRGGSYNDPDVAKVASELRGGLEAVTEGGSLSHFVRQQVTARRGAAPSCAEPQEHAPPPGTPILREASGRGERIYLRPLWLRTLALDARCRALDGAGPTLLGGALVPSEGPAPLPSLLFSAWWSTDDLRADLALDPELRTPGAAGPGWLGLGSVTSVAGPDSADQARARVTALDERLDAWQIAQTDLSPDAAELLSGLQLVAVYRAQLLVGWARAALLADRPLEAEVYARMGLDLQRLREVGPTNPPSLYVLLAEALVRTNRAREALDALQPLAEQDPYLVELTEPLGDLAVLKSMDRLGDSKEN